MRLCAMLTAKLLRKSPYVRNTNGGKKRLVVASTAGGARRAKPQVFLLPAFLLLPRSIAKMR
jgi:hypothetical protein